MTREQGGERGQNSFTEFAFTCTDRGQHREFPLRSVMVRPGSADFVDMAEYPSFTPAERQSMYGGAVAFDEFFCTGCRRNLRINHAKLVVVVQELRQLGITVLDISKLPF